MIPTVEEKKGTAYCLPSLSSKFFVNRRWDQRIISSIEAHYYKSSRVGENDQIGI